MECMDFSYGQDFDVHFMSPIVSDVTVQGCKGIIVIYASSDKKKKIAF